MKVTVKTIDSGSEVFELKDEITVGGLKQEILSKMGIALDQQRLIFQGKVLKDGDSLKEYDVDGKVIHLVKRPPPSQSNSSSTLNDGSSSTGAAEVGGEGRGITVQASQDVVFVGNIPVSSHSDISQVTQTIVDQIVGSLTSHGTQAQVSAEAITTDASGAMHTATVSATTTQRAEPKPTPPPSNSSQPADSKKETVKVLSTARDPPPISTSTTTSSTTSSRSQRLAEQAEEREAELQRLETERNQRQLRSIHTHSRTVRRCIQFATKILDRFDRAASRVAEAERKKKASGKGETDGKEDGETWGPVEPMEVLEGKGEGAEGGGEDRYADLDKSTENPVNLSSSIYVKFLEDIETLQKRAQPHVLEYKRSIAEDRQLTDDEVRVATRVALTVKDFNYYIGHAYVSLSRLHINMSAVPPRIVRLTAPRRTEMRRMMNQFRPPPPGSRREGPSGYIVDISRDEDNSGQVTERRSTRAVVNRGGGGFPGFGGLFGGMGLSGLMSMDSDGDNDKDASKERGGAEPTSTNSGTQPADTAPPKKEKMEASTSSGSHPADGNTAKTTALPSEERMEVEEGGDVSAQKGGDEVRSKEEAKDGDEVKSKVVVKDTEDVGSKDSRQSKPQQKEEKEGKDAKKDGKGEDGDSDDETPQYLARLLSELITGVADPAGPYRPSKGKDESKPEGFTTREEDTKEGASNRTENAKESAETKDEERGAGGNSEEGEGGRKRTFAERYAGPEGTTVTISAAPAPPFGIPGLPPMEGPSLSIKNRGDGAEPEMTINFPMPPAIQLLQSLLHRAEERHRQRREAGETSSEDSDDDDDDEGTARGGEGDDKPKKKKKKKADGAERAFLEEDGEVKSISDAGSIDSIDSDHEEPPEFENPMSHIAASAMQTLHTGEHISMLDTMAEVRNQLGAPPDDDEDDDSELSMVEQILKVVSRELSVVEVMQVFKGQVEPAQRLQPSLFNFVRDKLLDGAEPTKQRCDQAVAALLTNCRPSIEAVKADFPLRDSGLDFPTTIHKVLQYLCREAYEYIVTEYNEKENEEKMFAHMMHHWATHSSGLFSSVIRHCVTSEELFVDTINKLIGTLFPPNTPSFILDMCSDSILKEMVRIRKVCPYTPRELDRHVYWKEGAVPTPNTSHPLSAYAMNQSTIHPHQMLPFPVKDSCPGGPSADDGNEGSNNKFPPGVPEEWVSAIKRDREADSSRAGPQRPFSEAYLAGMPPKRRKQLDTSQPLSISEQDLTLVLMEEALLQTGAQTTNGKSQLEMLSLAHHNVDITSSVAADVYSIQRDRCLSSSNFDKEKYPNCTQLYKLIPREEL